MDFDHLPQYKKSYNISHLRNHGNARQLILEELEKCELVCANCHRLRTAARKPKPQIAPPSYRKDAVRLTDAKIDSLAPGTYWDENLRGFGIRVGKHRKTFITVRNGHRTSIGHYPNTSLKEARIAAQKVFEKHHPQALPNTLLAAKLTYLQNHVTMRYKRRTAYNTMRLLLLTEPIDHKRLSELTSHDITSILDALKPSQANHLFGVLRTFFGWCERRDYIAASPIRKLTKPHREKDRKRTLTDKELIAIWNACEDDSFGKIVRLLILTGQRRGEVAALESGWISQRDANSDAPKQKTSPTHGDLHSITFPPHITKNGEEHTIPLAAQAQDTISQAANSSSTANSYLLFPSSKTGTVITGWAKLKEALDKRSGVKDWTLHDLRRTFSTRCAELGVAPHIIERCLNHLTGSISPLARRYNHATYQAEMKAAFDLWDAHISRLISPQSSP